jgi:protocatechuate 3,4-dioxygenase beta subunit
MERKLFLKGGLAALGVAFVAPLANSCKKESSTASTTSTTTTTTTSGSCSVSPSETAGPYPTVTPSSYVRSNIVDGQTGVPLTIKLTILNTNNSCAALSGAIVDIWHCTALGYYSEYDDTPGGNYARRIFCAEGKLPTQTGWLPLPAFFRDGTRQGRRISMRISITLREHRC